jgi:divalent metal cation (Fe/Co/Zn/Cd) transporter
MASQDEHNRELQRQVEMRIRRIESSINQADIPLHNVQQMPEKPPKLWKKRVILGVKLFGLGVAVLVAVRVASALAGIIIFAVLGWVAYKLFIESSNKRR